MFNIKRLLVEAVAYLALFEARKGNIAVGQYILDTPACRGLLSWDLWLGLAGAVGWQEGIQAYRARLAQEK